MNTEYIDLTEMWQDGEYADVARIINEESWSQPRLQNFALTSTNILVVTNLMFYINSCNVSL